MSERIRVLAWSELSEPKRVYPNGISGALAEHLGSLPDMEVRTASLDDPDQGVRLQALHAVGKLRLEPCLAPLLARIREGGPEAARRCRNTVSRLTRSRRNSSAARVRASSSATTVEYSLATISKDSATRLLPCSSVAPLRMSRRA